MQTAYDHFNDPDHDDYHTFTYPKWLYGKAKGKLARIEIEDCPNFGENSFLEIDTGRLAFISIDVQVDFAGYGGYVDTLGYDIEVARRVITPIQNVLAAVRAHADDILVLHTRETHRTDLADAFWFKILRSKLIGGGYGIGEVPPGGLGRLLIEGQPNHDIIPEVYPIAGEPVINKAGHGFLGTSNLQRIMDVRGIKYLVIAGLTTDVCVHTIMREADDNGYIVVLLRDATESTDESVRDPTFVSTKLEGGIFGHISYSDWFIDALEEAYDD
jgi:nicotinamidase-related amidase